MADTTTTTTTTSVNNVVVCKSGDTICQPFKIILDKNLQDPTAELPPTTSTNPTPLDSAAKDNCKHNSLNKDLASRLAELSKTDQLCTKNSRKQHPLRKEQRLGTTNNKVMSSQQGGLVENVPGGGGNNNHKLCSTSGDAKKMNISKKQQPQQPVKCELDDKAVAMPTSIKKVKEEQQQHQNTHMQTTCKTEKNTTGEKFEFEFKIGSIVYAKPYGSDVWFEAELEKEIYDDNIVLTRYQVRFLGGEWLRRKIPLKYIASKNPINISRVELGTRIVAARPSDTVSHAILKKYGEVKNDAIINIIFAGVVAELACVENKFRYLIFFDDGYAQYFHIENLYLVLQPPHPVWEDLPVGCRRFTKEYLEEYPYRPLVCTTVGTEMKTEWNGEWWTSRVTAIDGSLIKIFYYGDEHSEWIYRGSTRLEILHKDFIELQPVVVEDGYTYVDKKITNPQFGVSRYSLSDPKGFQQIKEWRVPPGGGGGQKRPPQQTLTLLSETKPKTEELIPLKKCKDEVDTKNIKCETLGSKMFTLMSSDEVEDILGALKPARIAKAIPKPKDTIKDYNMTLNTESACEGAGMEVTPK